MVVKVKLFAIFRQGRFNRKQMELPEEASVGDLLSQLGIEEKEVGILLVNGGNATGQKKLVVNDVVSIFPLIAGG